MLHLVATGSRASNSSANRGTQAAAARRIGASSVSKPSSATIEVSASRPTLPGKVLLDDEEPRRPLDRGEHGAHVEWDEAAQVDDLDADAVTGEALGGGQRDRHRRGERDDGDVRAGRTVAASPSGTTWSGGAGSPLMAKRPLCSKNTDGISR